MDNGPAQDGPAGKLGTVRRHGIHLAEQRICVRAEVVGGDDVKLSAVVELNVTAGRAAQLSRARYDRVEHRLHLGRRPADNVQHRARRRLVL